MSEENMQETLQDAEFKKLCKNHRAKVYRAASKFQDELLELVDSIGPECLESIECLLSVLADITSKSESEQYLEPADYAAIWQEINLHLLTKVSDSDETLQDCLAEFGIKFPDFPEFGNSEPTGGKNKKYFFKMELSDVKDSDI